MQPQGFRCFDQKQHWTSHVVPWRTSALNPGVFLPLLALLLSYNFISTSSIFISVPLINSRTFHPKNVSPLSSTPRWFITVILLGNSRLVFVICIEVGKSNCWPLWSLWLALKWFLQLFCIQRCYIILLDGFCVWLWCFWSVHVLECVFQSCQMCLN